MGGSLSAANRDAAPIVNTTTNKKIASSSERGMDTGADPQT